MIPIMILSHFHVRSPVEFFANQSFSHLFSLPYFRYAVVSSKTKKSKKVYILHLEREALLNSSGSELTWKVMEEKSIGSLWA